MAPVLRYEDYRIAWIAVLPIETEAAIRMFDRRHDGHFETLPGDSTSSLFIGGEICGHNVVIATWPIGQSYGIGSAAELATDVRRRFRNIWFALLVGVAAGIPNLSDDPLQRRDIRLGDVLVCVPDQLSPGIVQYDHGKYTSSDGGIKFTPTGRQAQTDAVIRKAFGYIKYTSEFPFEDGNECAQYLKVVRPPDRSSKFDCPSEEHDILLATRSADSSEAVVIPRPKRPDSCRTYVWYGRIGFGDALVKSARKRDQLRDDYGIIGLEMEAAGTMNILPAGVIRGVCDYADGQKDKQWQPYAAAAAAAYAKCILHHTTPHKRQASDRPLKPFRPIRRGVINLRFSTFESRFGWGLYSR
ncbi:nucleoside phosphorylase domain-containing protein [Elsinoe ampelina]|uniref:Nucleoside phosphorylase domain-containing protein n=1 Tax=Elsinoe ampelina TaxID=302913 RepID=A0A6A6G867_9PEZI|nr:nucleoside phosphorylase domain-containing protein [Elsinoe ampelina]